MSDQWDIYDDDDEYEDDGPTSRGGNPVSSLRKQLKLKEKEERSLREKLTKLETQVRETTIGNVIKSRGLPDKVARIIPKDIEPSEEEVTKWLEEYGDVFGIQTEKPAETEKVETTENQAAIQQMNQIANNGNASSGSMQETLAALQSSDLTEDKLAQIIQRGGVF